MVRKIKVYIAAKVNLSLNVTGRANGYHLLDSVFASIDLYDTVTVAERLDGRVKTCFTDGRIDPRDNRALLAARKLRERFGDFGADIAVENRIPVGGGLGGSSADAAGVIAALDRLYDFGRRGADLHEIAAEVGSDVPFMLRGGLARVTGRGEKLEFFTGMTDKTLVLALPDTPVSTPACFKQFDADGCGGKAADNDRLIAALKNGSDFSPYTGNVLTAPASKLNPDVQLTLEAIASAGGVPVMSGSGSACLGIFDAPPTLSIPYRTVKLLTSGVRFG